MRRDLITALATATGLNQSSVRKIMSTAPIRYKIFYIPKRNGMARQIAQPSREVKLLQRAFTEVILSKLPVHQCASAYSPGCSIRLNALPHRGTGPILKMDFQDFFPSIKRSDWIQFCSRTQCITDPEEVELSSLLLFHKKSGYPTMRLAIGAPSSPSLSNVLMFKFDERINEFCSERNIVYTRYADDLTFSASRAGYLRDVNRQVKRVLKESEFPKIRLNESKTNFITGKYKRVVTGLVLANDGRVTIGREVKRTLHASVHNALMGKLSSQQLRSLGGRLAFASSIEPDFVAKLRERYGWEIFQHIKSATSV